MVGLCKNIRGGAPIGRWWRGERSYPKVTDKVIATRPGKLPKCIWRAPKLSKHYLIIGRPNLIEFDQAWAMLANCPSRPKVCPTSAKTGRTAQILKKVANVHQCCSNFAEFWPNFGSQSKRSDNFGDRRVRGAIYRNVGQETFRLLPCNLITSAIIGPFKATNLTRQHPG